MNLDLLRRPYPAPALRYVEDTYRVWPAGFYTRFVEVKALNAHQARTLGAIKLGVSGEKVRLQIQPRGLYGKQED